MKISRDEFIKKLSARTERTENPKLSEFFSNLNGGKETVFGNIYDATFSKKLCDVREGILNGLLIAFIGSEKDNPGNKWLIDEINEIIPGYKELFQKIKCVIKEPIIEDPKLEFEEDYKKENYTDIPLLREIKKSQVSLFELFSTEKGQLDLIKKSLGLYIKQKANIKELPFLEKVLERVHILSQDIGENKIYVDAQNKIDTFILWIIRKYIKPLEIINTSEVRTFDNENIEPDFMIFVENYFSRCMMESGATNLINHCKINKISLQPGNFYLEFRIQDGNMRERLDEQLFKTKIKSFFPSFNFFYHVGNPVGRQDAQTKSIKSKPLIINSPIAIKTSEEKTLDNFYNLEENQVEGIINLIREGKNIAICGTTGSGKTHLVQALKNKLKSEFNIVYTTGEKFCNVFRNLAKNYKGENTKDTAGKSFLDSFEGIDVLIIDGIEYLGGATRGATQNILKQILNKNPDMRLIITSKTGLNNIARTKKHQSKDNTVGYESASITEEIKGLNLAMLQSPEKQKSEKIIKNQWINFLNRKNDLFLPRELPVGVVNFLSRKVNPSLYEQIFESIRLNSSKDFSCEEIFKIIQNLVSEKIKAEPEEIIETIIESFANDGKKIAGNIALGTDISLWNEGEIRERFFSERKEDHFRKTMVSFCVFFIKQAYPKKNWNEIGSYFGNRKDCGKLYNDALETITNRKELLRLFENNIKNFLLKSYGVDGAQISMF